VRACIVVCFCAVAAHCSKTRSCVRVHCGLLLCSCCSRTRSCVHALWSAAVQLLLKDTVVRACIVVCFCAVAAQGHGHACVHCGLLLCSCCSLLKDTVVRACIVVCFTTYAACSIARKEGVKQALIWTCHKQLHRHTHQSTESTAPH